MTKANGRHTATLVEPDQFTHTPTIATSTLNGLVGERPSRFLHSLEASVTFGIAVHCRFCHERCTFNNGRFTCNCAKFQASFT